jgi:hypothetical protein
MESKRKIGRRDFLQKGSMAAFSIPVLGYNADIMSFTNPQTPQQNIKPEWRNKQSGMIYRQLGRTGLMVSELVYGTERNNPIIPVLLNWRLKEELIISIQRLLITRDLPKQLLQRYSIHLQKEIMFSLQQRSLLFTPQETGFTGRYLINFLPPGRRRYRTKQTGSGRKAELKNQNTLWFTGQDNRGRWTGLSSVMP